MAGNEYEKLKPKNAPKLDLTDLEMPPAVKINFSEKAAKKIDLKK